MSALHDVGAAPGDGRTSEPSPGAVAAVAPVRASGLQLIGELPGSGYREPPFLVRRSDGQTIQLPRLLYAVLSAVDGERTPEQVAAYVGPQIGRHVTAENVATLVARLRELGLLRLADGSEPEVRRSNPLLALRFRYVVSDPEVTSRITAPFARLFAPVVVAVLCLAFVAVCAWVLFEKGLASATHNAFDQPLLLLGVFALTVISAGFHEFGHAAAARYGGARPGAMGAGLYLVWPAFYTDVTDSYRLGRAGRVRTDLGGLYFNAVVAVVMFGVWWLSRWDAVLLIIATQVLQMLRQLAPLVRFDGYHVLADVTGVPDLYQRIRPTLLGLLPGRWNSPEATVLKPWARAVVTTWVLVVVPVLLGALVLMVLAVPRLLGTAAASLREQSALLAQQFGDGDAAGVLVRVLSIVAIALPVLGTVYIIGRTVRQAAVATWRNTQGRPSRRAAAGVVAAALVAALAWAWWPDPGAYRPIQAYERGAVQDAAPALMATPATTRLVEGRQGSATTVWPAGQALPTAEKPALAVVMVPRTDGAAATGGAPAKDTAGVEGGSGPVETAPTWVFPFDRPLPPGDGDNQALAVNTTDGSTLYDVAFALVWADGDTVLNTNEAYALASCTGCQTVAVAFQVVLVLGQANVVVPQNLAAAVNYSCMQCVTYALAQQLVVTIPGELDAQTMARLEALWREIAEFATSIEDLPLSELQSRLSDYEGQILQIVASDPGATPTDERTATQPGASTTPETATPTEPQGQETSPSPTNSVSEPEPSTTSEPSEEPDPGTPTSTSTATETASPTASPTAAAAEETADPAAAAPATTTP